MTRKEFIRLCTILGVGLPIQQSLIACKRRNGESFEGKVIIIGAGAGGLSAAYLLQQQGIEFELLEASDTYGGRMKTTKDFADFPIPLGAEWLHSKRSEFDDIVNDANIDVSIETVEYSEDDYEASWNGDKLTISPLKDDGDLKFVNSTWMTFYEDYILPSISDKITYNEVVSSISYAGNKIQVTTGSETYECDKVILSVPLKILQRGDISFNPILPESKREAINGANVWNGFKAFFEFSERFYQTSTTFEISPETDGQKLYYDAAYGQNTQRHVLGLFAVGKPSDVYTAANGESLKQIILDELDEIYAGKASASYVKHIVQNWNDEPFIGGAYLTDHADWREVRTLGESVASKLYFAGGPFTNGTDWVSVHAAAASARDAINEILG